jgi:hypothetical protein
MPNTIQIKRSNTGSSVPTTLADGELAVNTADRRLYFKDSVGDILNLPAESIRNEVTTPAAVACYGDGSESGPALSFIVDTSTGFWLPGTGSLAASTDGIERLRITSNGNVLVGLTSDYDVPSKLQTTSLAVAGADITAGGQIPSFVSRGSCFLGNAAGTRGVMVATTTGSVLAVTGLNYTVTAYNDICLQAGNSWQVFCSTTGRVGINHNSPTGMLEVRGAGATTGRTFSATNSSSVELLWCLDSGNQFSSSGRFANAGDARSGKYHARNVTTNTAATTNLFLNGSSTNIVVSATSAYMFLARVTAYSTTTNQAAVFLLRGGIRRNAASGTSLIGTVTKESWIEAGLTGVDANVIADDSTEALRVQVNGLATATIRWHAVIETSEVSFGAQ